MPTRLFALIVVLCTSLSASADEETLWRDARASVTQLLNDGWSIHGFSSRDTEWRRDTSTQGIGPTAHQSVVVYPRSYEVNFILTKNGKWIWCAVTEPSIEARVQSRCRMLN